MGIVDNIFGSGNGSDAADAVVDAANIEANYRKMALEYLKEREAIPQQYREEAIGQLGAFAGLGGADAQAQQEQAIELARSSPLYKAIMGTREQGEEAILRQASATGGLRSGSTSEALYDYNTQLGNQALLTAYNQQQQQLGRLAGLPSLAPSIAEQTVGIGETLGAGAVGAARTEQAGQQQTIDNLLGLGALGLKAYSAFSDIRLKEDIQLVGKRHGYNWYVWKWNKQAEKLGLFGYEAGYMAHEINEVLPDAISEKNGYAVIDIRKVERETKREVQWQL